MRDLSNFWPPTGTRYIGFLSFAFNYYLGGLNVFSYHLVNIIIHIINSLLVWWLVVLTFRTPVMERINTNPQLKYFIPITASLIFVSHPIQTQAVTYIVQRFASLATLFYLLSLALYIKARILLSPSPHVGEGRGEGNKGKFLIFYLASLFSAILAMKTKEISFTLPFVVILYEFMFFSPAYATTVKEVIVGQGFSLAKRLIYLTPIALTDLIIPLSLIGTDKPVGDMIGELREAAQETEEIPRNVYLLTQFRVIVTYIRLLFLPINQNLDYDYPLSHSLFEPATFLSFIFLSAIFAFAVYLVIRPMFPPSPLEGEGKGLPSNVSIGGEGRYAHLASFGILWFFITLSVESSIIPIRDVIFEHRLYLPSVGAIIAFSSGVLYGVTYTREKLDIKVSLLPITFILLLATAFPLGIAAYKRNFVWKNEINLWEDVVRKSPEKARGHNNLGVAYKKEGLFDKAITAYQMAIRLNADYTEAYSNIGVIYQEKGLLEEAIKKQQEALKINPNYPSAHYNLGLVHQQRGFFDKAIIEYRAAIGLKYFYPKAYNNLGLIYQQIGLLDDAISEFQKAALQEPLHPEIHSNLGRAYQKKGLFKEAINEYKIAINLNPNSIEAHNNLGSVYQDKELWEEAILEYRTAVKLNPKNPAPYYNLALSLEKTGNRKEAVENYRIFIEMASNDYNAYKKAAEERIYKLVDRK